MLFFHRRISHSLLILLVIITRSSFGDPGDPNGEPAETSSTENDFAEFDEEEFINEPVKVPAKTPASTKNDAGSSPAKEPPGSKEKTQGPAEDSSAPAGSPPEFSVDEDLDEDEAIVESEGENEQYDPQEFEGYEDDVGGTLQPGSSQKTQELKITDVPIVLGRSWEHYYVEYLLISGLLLYLIWYASGKTTNSKLANAWLDVHHELLKTHFSLVGDEGTTKELPTAEITEGEEGTKAFKFIKEADHVYTLWCSGRTYVEGLVVTLKMKKRQDLINSVWRMFRPCADQICVRVYMEKEEMDSFVLGIAKKQATAKLQKEMAELGLFCPDRKSGDRFGLPTSFNVLSEIGESVSAVLDNKVLGMIEKYESEVEYLFFSDQYNPKVEESQQAQQLKRPDPLKILQFCFNLPKDVGSPNEVMEHMQPLLLMSFYLIDKVHRYQLTREAKLKAEKNRQKVQEEFLKSTHAQRQEAAQLRREEKRRVEKERILSEDDPEKQRKWEERDYRREMKKRGPKVKAVKVKAM